MKSATTSLHPFARAPHQPRQNCAPLPGTSQEHICAQTDNVKTVSFYDRDSNRLTRSNGLNSSFSEQYSYDNLNRLTSFTRGSHSQSWGLDGVGNWNSFTNDGSTQTRSFNNQNQLTAISGATTPTYDYRSTRYRW